jgi:aspartate kinase
LNRKLSHHVGFFGVLDTSILDSIGRGYSDLTAALLAVGLKASELHIWKTVDGVFTADPSLVPTALQLATLTPHEAAELTYYGSQVIHPFTMQQVIQAGIPIRIRNSFNKYGGGTLIDPHVQTSRCSPVPEGRSKLATAITVKDPVIVINVQSNKQLHSHGFFAQIFSIMDSHGLVIDLISTSQVHISMALHTEPYSDELLQLCIQDLNHYGTVTDQYVTC